MTIDTYGDARALTPGPRLYDANGDHWIRAGWDHHAVLTPVHRLPADTIDLYMPPPGASLPYGPFTPHDNDPGRPLDPTHDRIRAYAAYERAERARQRADQAAARLTVGKRPEALRPVRVAVERAFRAREDLRLIEEAWHAFKTLANVSDSVKTRDRYQALAREAAIRTPDLADAAHGAAGEADQAADQIGK